MCTHTVHGADDDWPLDCYHWIHARILIHQSFNKVEPRRMPQVLLWSTASRGYKAEKDLPSSYSCIKFYNCWTQWSQSHYRHSLIYNTDGSAISTNWMLCLLRLDEIKFVWYTTLIFSKMSKDQFQVAIKSRSTASAQPHMPTDYRHTDDW